MLLPTSTPGLCQGCRHKLLILFDLGFTKASEPQRFSRTTRHLSKLLRVSRPATTTTRLRNISYRSQSWFSDEKQKGIEQRQDQSFPRDATAGGASEQSVRQQDGLSALLAQGSANNVEEHAEDQRSTKLPEEQIADPIAALRNDGAQAAAIAREARQTYGETLPGGVLNEEEYRVYLRLYDEPEEIVEDGEELADQDVEAQEESAEAVELLAEGGQIVEGANAAGGHQHDQLEIKDQHHTTSDGSQDVEELSLSATSDGPRNRMEQIAESLGGDLYDAKEATDMEDQDEASDRSHPLTTLGRFGPYPRTVYPPLDAFVRPVEKILADYSNKHLKEMCERTFGGGGLPNSSLTPKIGRIMPQVPIPLEASQHSMGEMEANAFMTVVMTSTYASVMSTLAETRKRLGSSWLRDLLSQEGGPRVLDVGSGGAGILAWREVIQAEWKALHTSDRNPPPVPPTKAVVLTGSDTIRHRASSLLDNTTFIPRLPDYVHVRDLPTLDDSRLATQRKEFDVIIASHSLWGYKEDWERRQHVQNLWSLLSPTGGVLIMLEKGVPRGFEAIAGARDLLLSRHVSSPGSTSYPNTLESPESDTSLTTPKGKGMIIAPCTNHNKCPMYPIPGLSRGRKDYCSFQQRYIRPGFLQRILGAKDRSHDDVDFSFISVLKGRDLRERQSASEDKPIHAGEEKDQASEDKTTLKASEVPRVVYAPLKRRGHVTLDVCTSVGSVERWTVPKSFSRQAYRDARKASWGDLWALSAKTKIPRNLRLGGAGTKEGERVHRSRKERIADKAAAAREKEEEEGLAEMDIERELEGEIARGVDKDVERMFGGRAEMEAEVEQAVEAELGGGSRKAAVPKGKLKKRGERRQQQARTVTKEEEDVEAALAEWEDEYTRDIRVGKKPVRSVREGTKVKPKLGARRLLVAADAAR